MPRAKSHTRDDLISSAMLHFWRHGYESTSMDDLVRVTGVSRHGIYLDTGSKQGLFAACLDAYVRIVVTPAFASVELPGATLDAVAQFFEYQIACGEAAGLLGQGCLMANTLTEVASHNAAVLEIVERHNTRLGCGFRNALAKSAGATGKKIGVAELDDLSLLLVVFANGLWSMSRTVVEPATLRRAVHEMLQLMHGRINR